ncbi:hypothetical protein [Propionibacterium freudenreichii]|uniref:hypothetical protein n=1 Tax=Propionibacterium freudenreichii TaxID=1744 RepID=UPI0005A5C619|nr:hypothetical protein [Propionibacterium freudenreichii]MDK9347949.1 hypothetical protein [Propionibacterium freudenreichii]MDK9627920.1 hypothetical protein [Propionibacterium freudenreichii]MDK9652151.1 hypothetical protein [Propionibacterium freudenreichii]CEI32853.1 Protein of unknown function [Propionibacterium freudenreichii]SBN41138.1 Hypothetical protein PFR_JS4_1166 [Propionibacterium freudenreichii]
MNNPEDRRGHEPFPTDPNLPLKYLCAEHDLVAAELNGCTCTPPMPHIRIAARTAVGTIRTLDTDHEPNCPHYVS